MDRGRDPAAPAAIEAATASTSMNGTRMNAAPPSAASRCRRCILPRGYCGVTFDPDGCCSLCRDHAPTEYRGLDALRSDLQEILKRHPRRRYDGLVAFSGGRDSSYLLHIAKHVLDLNVLALFIDHGLVPPETHRNVEDISRALGVPLIVHRHDRLLRCFPHQFGAWLRKPRPHTLSTLCMGCKSNIIRSVYEHARIHRAPLLMWGWTPFEGARYKMDLMRVEGLPGRMVSYVVGYAREVLANPRLVMNPACAATQLTEFYTFFGPYKSVNDRLHGKVEVKPFEAHLHWREAEIGQVLEEKYAWRKLTGLKSAWRGDCYLAPIRQYLYRAMLGYDDKVYYLSALVRDGQLTREEALARLEQETVPDDVLVLCCRKLGIRPDTLRSAVARYRAAGARGAQSPAVV
jgi:hypothetical protein